MLDVRDRKCRNWDRLLPLPVDDCSDKPGNSYIAHREIARK